MKNIFASLLLVFACIFFITSAYAQETTFKPGDKVEASFLGVWMKGRVKEKAGEKYTVTLDDGGYLKFKPKNIRLLKDDNAAATNTTNASAAAPQAASNEDKSNNSEYYLNQGRKYFATKQYQESAAASQQAILLNPKDYRAYHNLGLAYVYLGNNDEAVSAFKHALSLSPDNSTVYHGLGSAYYLMGNYKEAIAAFNQALALDPNNTALKDALADTKAALAKSGDANEIKAVSPGDAQPSVTAEDLHKEFQKNFYAAKEKYEGKTLKVTGKVKYVNVSDGEVTISLTDNGFSTPVEFLLPDAPANRKVDVGSTITGVGTVYRIFAGAFGKVQFKPCTLVGSEPEPEKPAVAQSSAPADVPMGLYNVYQGVGFKPQGSLTLYKNGTYKRYESDMGNYSYNPATKVIRFTSGLLEGFVGLYYTSGRNNEKNEPMLAIDYEGKVPDVSNASNGQYLYAIFDKP